MSSMQRSASSVGDAFTEAVASASRSVGAFGLEREIASYESKIRARKRQFGVEAYGPLRAADRQALACLLYTSPSPRDATLSRMPSSA